MFFEVVYSLKNLLNYSVGISTGEVNLVTTIGKATSKALFWLPWVKESVNIGIEEAGPTALVYIITFGQSSYFIGETLTISPFVLLTIKLTFCKA